MKIGRIVLIVVLVLLVLLGFRTCEAYNRLVKLDESVKEQWGNVDQLAGSLSRLMMTVERYPDLKTTQQFQDLQAQLEGTENRIANERRNFNAIAKEFNTYQRRFPQVFFARLFGFDTVGYFGAQPGAEMGVKVDFSETEKD